MQIKELLDKIAPYCDKIIKGNKHIKAYVKGTNSVITIASTSSDRNFHRQVYRDFRRKGVIIKELNY
jgi:hypothetical protein